MRQRLLEHPASGGDGSAGAAVEVRDLELGELAVSNPASASAGRAQAASERASSSGARLGSSATISVSL
jgi:hypothetical protein